MRAFFNKRAKLDASALTEAFRFSSNFVSFDMATWRGPGPEAGIQSKDLEPEGVLERGTTIEGNRGPTRTRRVYAVPKWVEVLFLNERDCVAHHSFL